MSFPGHPYRNDSIVVFSPVSSGNWSGFTQLSSLSQSGVVPYWPREDETRTDQNKNFLISLSKSDPKMWSKGRPDVSRYRTEMRMLIHSSLFLISLSLSLPLHLPHSSTHLISGESWRCLSKNHSFLSAKIPYYLLKIYTQLSIWIPTLSLPMSAKMECWNFPDMENLDQGMARSPRF